MIDAEFIGRDANFTDGSDLSKAVDIYRYRGQEVRIPATTADVETALYAALGLDPALERGRSLRLKQAREAETHPILTPVEVDAVEDIADVKAILKRLVTTVQRLTLEIEALRNIEKSENNR